MTTQTHAAKQQHTAVNKQSNEQRYYDALKQIAKGFMTVAQIERDAERTTGLDKEEYLEYAYENIKQTAANAIRGRRRPQSARANNGGGNG